MPDFTSEGFAPDTPIPPRRKILWIGVGPSTAQPRHDAWWAFYEVMVALKQLSAGYEDETVKSHLAEALEAVDKAAAAAEDGDD